MARIPESELERLKAEVSIERLAEARGMKLVKKGKDLFTQCIFHEGDREPSLVISPGPNLFHCLGCGAGGSVIDFVIRTQGVSFTHAVQLLRADLPASTASGPAVPVKRSTVRKLPGLLAADAEDRVLLGRVVDYYHQTLKESPEALAYLKGRGLDSAELVSRFKLGYANRTLGYRLPEKNRQEGAAIRGRLQKLGIYRESGHEHLSGSLVVPVFDAEGGVSQLYGRKIRDDLRKGTATHLYLPSPLRGVFNREALQASPTIILCEAVIDALSFWVAGFRNVTTAYGVNHVPPELWDDFKTFGTRRVLIAFDRDEAGEKAATELAPKLQAAGIEVFRIQFPKGMDANEYLCTMKPAAKAFELVIRNAVWMGQGKAPALTSPITEAIAPAPAAATPAVAPRSPTPFTQPTPAQPAAKAGPEKTASKSGRPDDPVPTPASAPSPALAPPPLPPLAAPSAATPTPAPTPPAAKTAPAAPPAQAATTRLSLERDGEDLWTRLGDRTYRIRGLERNTAHESLKVSLRVSRARDGVEGAGGFHLDTVDFNLARSRQAFIVQGAAELGHHEETLKRDLGQLLLALELARDQAIARRLAPDVPKPAEMSDVDREAALSLLRSPDLLDQVLADFRRCGVVGEVTNKLVGYLAVVSRKLDRPLAIVIQSSSAAGKSSLQDAVLAFMPEEEKVIYSAMTGQALFYMGETNLAHKILAVAEEEGAQRASYSLKLLQSEGELKIASTGKDPATGKLVTHEYTVKGPVMLFLTTTAIVMDEELMNRCLVLTVDESREQTRAIHRMQREQETLTGMLEGLERPSIRKRHQNAQRLLRPLLVVNPYAEELTFLDHQTRARRDHPKYLTMIRAIALLHQYQREIKTTTRDGKEVAYVEVTRADIAVANRLAREVLSRSVDELPPQTRRLLTAIVALVKERAKEQGIEPSEVRFTRRAIREHAGFGPTQTHLHLHRLEELEYVLAHGGGPGQPRTYELVYQEKATSEEGLLHGLPSTEPASGCGYDANRSGAFGGLSGGFRATFGGLSAPPDAPQNGTPSQAPELAPAEAPKTHSKGNGGTHPGHTQIATATGPGPRGNGG